MHRIRKARVAEFGRLNEIERIADQLYATVGLNLVLQMQNVPRDRLAEGPVWVACDHADVPVGFLLAGAIDGYAYIEQISVLPDHGRKGIGSTLMQTALAWGKTTPARAMVLSTYRDVPWNQPFYERLGFVEMPETEWNEEIIAARRLEAEQGHDLERRLFMWRKLR